MGKGIHFRNKTYGLGGILGGAHPTAIHEYGDWAHWAQIPAGNVAERDEGLNNYVRSLTWNAYISEFDTPDERNDGRTQETAVLSFIHMEYFVEMDELRQETMLPTTAAFAALKQPGGRGGGGGGSAMRAEKPEKMVAEMQTLELIDELRLARMVMTRAGMASNTFSAVIPGSRPSSTTTPTSMRRTWSGVPRLRLSRSESSSKRSSTALMTQVFGQRRPLSERYLFARSSRCLPALISSSRSCALTRCCVRTTRRDMSTPVSEMNRSGERRRSAVEHLLTPIEVAVRDHLTDVSLAGHVILGYDMNHFTEWTVMAKQVRRLAIHKRLDPKSSSSLTPYGKNMMKAQDSESEDELDGGRKNDRMNPLKNRWKNREARVAQDCKRGGGGERRGAMLCCNRPNQSAFKQGDERIMPPRRPGGTANNFCVYHWHEKLVARRRALAFTEVT